MFTRIRDGYFLGPMVVVARLLEISHPGVWGGRRGQPQELRHEDIQISFKINQAASLVSRDHLDPCLV